MAKSIQLIARMVLCTVYKIYKIRMQWTSRFRCIPVEDRELHCCHPVDNPPQHTERKKVTGCIHEQTAVVKARAVSD